MRRQMLIVDDQQDVCECLGQFFRSKGFVVSSAFSGEEALKQLHQEPPDVVLLDILLPGLSGIEVLKRIRVTHPNVRVLMVTALDETELRSQALRYGAAAYITKPFNFETDTWAAALAG